MVRFLAVVFHLGLVYCILKAWCLYGLRDYNEDTRQGMGLQGVLTT